MPRPSDFFIGIHDFFAILMPGAATTYYLVEEGRRGGVTTSLTGASAAIAFAFASYMLGHLVFLLGSYLDPVYDRWRRRSKTRADDGTFRAAETLRKKESKELEGTSFSTLKWCRAYVALRSPAARTELDYLEATSKFFRSLVVILSLAAVAVLVTRIPDLHANRYLLSAVALGLAWLCFLRFCDQRWKLTELSYAYAVLLAKVPPQGATAASSEADQAAED